MIESGLPLCLIMEEPSFLEADISHQNWWK